MSWHKSNIEEIGPQSPLRVTLREGNVFHEQHNFLESVTATSDNESLFSFEYEFNPITANLMKRNLGVADEEFNYDEDGFVGLNRLTSSEIILSEENDIEEYTYSSNGNLESKTGVGEYVYDTNRLNAVDHIDQDGGMDEENANQIMLMQTVSYNHFNSVSELINVDNNLKVEFTYGPDDQRRKAEYFVGDIQQEWALEKTCYYVGSYEKQVDDVNNETEVHYISAGGMIVAMYVIENGIGQYYYPHQDHLGSIIHVTDENADIVYTQSFDAWGRTRNADDLTYEDITERPNWLWRGYTGHEHLDEFGLINMNGRLYDPVIGRMLSPDNYVQSPGFSQSYNRYSYAWNNPLKYTDPSGEMVWFIPNVSWSSQGGWDVSGTIAYGVPGNLSVQATLGHNFASSNTYFSVGASVGGYTGSVGWGTQTGFTAGLNYGLPGFQNGFGTNLTSYGINWSQNGGLSVSGFGYSYGKGGLNYNPSLGFSHSYFLGRKYPKVESPSQGELLANASLEVDLGLILGMEGQKNVPGGEWDMWGVGYVPYDGDAWFHTNFIGPGPNDEDPYYLPDPKNPGHYLEPIDQIDAAAQRHDAAYYKAKTGGIMGALFNTKVSVADGVLALSAHNIIRQYNNGNTNISPRTANIAREVRDIFVPLTLSKF